MVSFDRFEDLIKGSVPEKFVFVDLTDPGAMNQQSQPQNNINESAQQQGNSLLYKENEMGHPYMPQQCYGQHQNPANQTRDMNGLSQAFASLNIHGQRSNYGPAKGSTPVTSGANGDMSGIHRPQHGPFVVVSNPPVFRGTIPPVHHYGQIPTDQAGPFQYVPASVYPGFVTNGPYPPTFYPGYSWPDALNSEHDHTKAPRDWSPDEKIPTNGIIDGIGQPGQTEYYPVMASVHRSPVGAPMYTAAPQTPGACLSYQMMRAAGGYVLQDLDALVKQEPPIPQAVPAMWTNPSELTLAKCLENREGITNVYIRGFLPETTDEMLYAYASRFGKIDRCKAIVDLDTGLCKGNLFNSRLKDLEDKASTNIYCTNVPIEWVEAVSHPSCIHLPEAIPFEPPKAPRSDLRRHFEPYRVISEKISRDENTGISKEVGFARFETREIAEKVLMAFHNVNAKGWCEAHASFCGHKGTKATETSKQRASSLSSG
ncbi:conserved hypothetical protein [Uncinocarpus reesii 1704]|uniref:RRM domain-containing protein n=1 Tax=Uncinocarpus reesii (strain UAMH 1704) TaxID=336963 RepID=C4JDE8_UNCRE|nr:uncharacterized protein UREG_00313 [Uncinocarpus reesii 1704]EEP75467.1 conserved hypothetical protein [Uncinocarpus reesii 1704]